MALIKRLNIKSSTKRPRFKHRIKRHGNAVKIEIHDAIRDLFKDPIPANRCAKKLTGKFTKFNGKKVPICGIRVEQNNLRITFHMEGTLLVLRNVGTHSIYDNP